MNDKVFKSAMAENNRLNFDGDSFKKASKTWKSQYEYVALDEGRHYPGVTFIQSDPIHGSIGVPPPPMEDLTPEQQFE